MPKVTKMTKPLNLLFDLVLTECHTGFSYEWHDQHGKIVCCGHNSGTKQQVQDKATIHLLNQKEL